MQSRHIRPVAYGAWAIAVLAVYFRAARRPTALHDMLHAAVVSSGAFWRTTNNAFPFFNEAATRNLLSLAAALLVLYVSYACGSSLLALVRWSGDDWRDQLLFRLVLGFGVVAYLSLALALAGLYRPPLVIAMLVVIAVAGLASRLFSRHVKARPDPGGRLDRRSLLWLALFSIATAIALVGALAPEIEFDALSYHLWLPKIWLQSGHPVDVPTEYVSLYPMTAELLFGAGLAVAGPIAGKLLHFACLPLLGLAVAQFTRRLFPDASPWLAAAILVTTPTVLWEATTAYNDLVLALYVTAGLYALLVHIDKQSRAWFVVGALSLALGAATKHLGLIVVMLAAFALLVSPRVARWKSIALGVTALLVASPWYLRTWLASGNPFFPEMYGLFGARPATRWDAITEHGLALFKARFGLPRTPLNLMLLPWNITEHAALFGGCLGAIFLVALPLIAWRAFTNRKETRSGPMSVSRTARTWLLIVTVGYIVIWASPVSSFQLRFLIPIVPALAILSADAFSWLLGTMRQPSARRAATAVLAGLLLLNLPPFIPLHEGDRQGWSGWLTHVIRTVPTAVVTGRQSESDYMRSMVATFGAWQFANSRLPANEGILEFGGGDTFLASRPRLSMDATAARPVWVTDDGESITELQRALSDLGIRHVLFDKSQLPSLERDRILLASPTFRSSAMQLEYEDAHALLYRLK